MNKFKKTINDTAELSILAEQGDKLAVEIVNNASLHISLCIKSYRRFLIYYFNFNKNDLLEIYIEGSVIIKSLILRNSLKNLLLTRYGLKENVNYNLLSIENSGLIGAANLFL